MRSIGELETAQLATRFCDYLLTVGIEAVSDPIGESPAGPCDVWVRDEEHLEQATNELARFIANPMAAGYDVEARATRIRAEQNAENQRRLKLQKRVQYKGAQVVGGSGGGLSSIPLTVAIVVGCVLATLLTNMGNPRVAVHEDGAETPTFSSRLFDGLSFVDWNEYIDSGNDPLASIRKGQIWRLITPMFIHLGAIHLLFNMLWMYQLGGAIERIQGWIFLLILILVCEVVAGLAQSLMPGFLGGSPFGFGASGAVYGLFGYLWIRPKYDQGYPYQLSSNTIFLMIAWLFLCMTGFLGPIGNGAHVGGLLMGMAAAPIACWLSARKK